MGVLWAHTGAIGCIGLKNLSVWEMISHNFTNFVVFHV